MSDSDHILKIVKSGRLIVCAGPGGVGKTTTSAALGLRAAMVGRRVIVLTIDPAKRLANSLGLGELTNQPQRIDLVEVAGIEVPEGGELWAMMLDQKQTLDDLVAKYAPDKGAVSRSHDNNIYKLLSSTLAGMQEYMALDKLHDLYTGGYYDLVVLDTPPTKNALEFLQTPGRARQFFDDRVLKWFLPNRGQRKGLLGRVMNPAGTVVLGLLSRIFGQAFVDDLVEFFDTLQFLQEALRTRGEMIDFILRDPATHFLVITSADARRIKEALYFHEKLSALDQTAGAFILNRVMPNFDVADLAEVDQSALREAVEAEGVPTEQSAELTKQLERQYAHLAELAAHNRAIIRRFGKQVGPDLLRTIPLFGEDVHDLEQLRRLGHFLTPSAQP